MITRGTDWAGATFSDDEKYRYSLWRRWGKPPKEFVVIGLNPSTATELITDPTIRRCIGFAQREGCGGLMMLNLFAYRSTDPKQLLTVADPIGPENDVMIDMQASSPYATVVAAWGAFPFARARAREIKRRYDKLYCLGFTKDGAPRHPLYLKLDAPLTLLPRLTPYE